MRSRGILAWIVAVLFFVGCPPATDDDAGDDDTTAGDDDTGDDDTGDDDTVPEDPLVYLTEAPPAPDTFLGCDNTITLELRNDSDVAVTVDDIEVDPGSEAFTPMASGPPPWVVPAGQAKGLGVSFHPQVLDESTGTLRLFTDHPDHAEVTTELSGTGTAYGGGMDQWTGVAESVVDILWVVDNSCSMSDNQEHLAAMGTAFVDFLVTTSVDYQIGVVTTDMAQLQGKPVFATPADKDVASWFSQTVIVGTNGSATEKPLQYGLEAVTPPLTDKGGANWGFVRPSAHLALMILTDEADQSPDTVLNYVDGLAAIKGGDVDKVTVNAIAGGMNGCTSKTGFIDAAPRLSQAAALTGGADVPICDQDWMPVLSQLPILQSYDPGYYPLSQPAMPLTVDVYVDDVQQTTGWSYDAKENAVIFGVQFIPDEEAEVKVLYVVPAETC